MKNLCIKLSLTAICLSAAFGLQSCDDKMKDLIGSKWTLDLITTAHGQELIPTDYFVITIEEGVLHIKLDVNSCRLPYELKDKNVLHITNEAMCTRACCDSQMAMTFKEKLHGDMEIILKGDELILKGEDTLTFHRWTKNDVKKEIQGNYLKIKRTGCFGTCPIYEMTLFDDGSASYVGKRFVEVTGRELHDFDKERIETLLRRAARLDFNSLQPVYDNPLISDMESVFIEYNEVVIKVRYKIDVPKELLTLIRDVHQCAIDAGWVKEQ